MHKYLVRIRRTTMYLKKVNVHYIANRLEYLQKGMLGVQADRTELRSDFQSIPKSGGDVAKNDFTDHLISSHTLLYPNRFILVIVKS